MTEPFYAHLSVISTERSLAHIEAVVDLRSDPDGWSKGDPGGRGGPNPRQWTRWKSLLRLDPSVHAGTAGLDAALAELTDDLADRLASCERRGDHVTLQIVQYFTDDDEGESTGLSLEPASIRWVARARASLDVDQYPYWNQTTNESGSAPDQVR